MHIATRVILWVVGLILCGIGGSLIGTNHDIMGMIAFYVAGICVGRSIH